MRQVSILQVFNSLIEFCRLEVIIYKNDLKDFYPTILVNVTEVSFADVLDFHSNTSYSAIVFHLH